MWAILAILLTACGDIAPDVDASGEVFAAFPMRTACANLDFVCNTSEPFYTYERYYCICDATLNHGVGRDELQCIADADNCENALACGVDFAAIPPVQESPQ